MSRIETTIGALAAEYGVPVPEGINPFEHIVLYRGEQRWHIFGSPAAPAARPPSGSSRPRAASSGSAHALIQPLGYDRDRDTPALVVLAGMQAAAVAHVRGVVPGMAGAV